jgi:hypothetical protein
MFNSKDQPDGCKKRGISEQTCEKFMCYRDGEKLPFYYFSSDGALLGAKVKR